MFASLCTAFPTGAAGVAACFHAACACYIKNTVWHCAGSMPGSVPAHDALPEYSVPMTECACVAHRHTPVSISLLITS